MQNSRNKPDVFKYCDYRSFLNAYYLDQKSQSKSFSIRSWCKHLGVSSSATMNMVLKGHRHPGDELTHKLIHYFEFSETERHFFVELIKLGKHKGSADLKIAILERLAKLHPSKEFNLLDPREFKLISRWHYFAIRELALRNDFQADAGWVRDKLRRKLSRHEAEEALQDLKEFGFLDKDSKPREQNVATSNDISDEAIKRFHEQTLELAKQSIREVETSDRQISGATFNIRQTDLNKIKEELFNFQKQLLKRYQHQDGDRTYQLNVQFFPLST